MFIIIMPVDFLYTSIEDIYPNIIMESRNIIFIEDVFSFKKA